MIDTRQSVEIRRASVLTRQFIAWTAGVIMIALMYQSIGAQVVIVSSRNRSDRSSGKSSSRTKKRVQRGSRNGDKLPDPDRSADLGRLASMSFVIKLPLLERNENENNRAALTGSVEK